jgi:hypothetical protein
VKRPLPIICLLLAGCNSVTAKSPEKSQPPRKVAAPAVPRATPAKLPPGATRAEGEVVYIEKSGQNLYIELKSAGRTVGVELLPAVTRRHAGVIAKGQQLAVHGSRRAGDKEIAYVVEVSDPDAVTLPGAVAGAQLARLRLPRSVPHTPVEMIAAYGLWPPVDEEEVVARVTAARTDRVSHLVVDTGLTELYRAYRDPGPYYKVIEQAAAEGGRQKIDTVFYFPSFELRREKKTRIAGTLVRWQPGWPQVTLSGKPLLKTAFGKEEFWNKEGDEALWVCPNSPWRAEFIGRMVQAVKRGARTIFVDVPYFQQAGKTMTCRCRHCQARFKRETGQSIPPKAAPGTFAYHRWLWWRHDVLAGFFRELKAAIRKASSKAKLVVEEYPAPVEGATTSTGVDIGLVGDEVDLFAHEYCGKQFDKKPFSADDRLELAAALALYRGLDDRRPTWVLSYAHDPAGSRVNATFHLCYDASFWETKGPEMNDTTVGRAWRRKLFAWFATHRQAFGSTRQLASVAVLYSPASRDFSADHFSTLRQVIVALLRARVPFRVLSTRDLDQLPDYPTLVLPAAAALAARDAAAIRKHGRRLLVVGAPPSKDGWGIKPVDHQLSYRSVSLARLPAALGDLPVKVEGDGVVVNLVGRPGEIQLRLANLKTRTARVTVSLLPPGPVKRATVLPLLGTERALEAKPGPDGVLQLAVQVVDLTVVRLRVQ